MRKYFLIWSGKRHNSTSIVLIDTLADVIPKRPTPLPPTYPEFPERKSISIDTRRPLPETPRSMQASKQRIECFARNGLKTAWKKSSFLVRLTETQRGVIQTVNRLTWIYCLGFNFEEPATRRGFGWPTKEQFLFPVLLKVDQLKVNQEAN